jgi:hypothetical protein
MQVIMARGRRGSRRHGVGGRGMKPPIVSMSEGSKPQGDEQTIEHGHVFVGDVVGMMRSF